MRHEEMINDTIIYLTLEYQASEREKRQREGEIKNREILIRNLSQSHSSHIVSYCFLELCSERQARTGSIIEFARLGSHDLI